MKTADIRVATLFEKLAAIDTMTLAFSTDPLIRWMYPDSLSYLQNAPLLFDGLAGESFIEGSAFVNSSLDGVAMWLDPGTIPNAAMMSPLLNNVRCEIKSDFFGLLKAVETYHPADENLWFLPLLGVDPMCQGQGVGSALMQYAAQMFDSMKVPAYLESSNPQNVSLYQRFGFEILAEVRCGESPVICPMYRSAK